MHSSFLSSLNAAREWQKQGINVAKTWASCLDLLLRMRL